MAWDPTGTLLASCSDDTTAKARVVHSLLPPLLAPLSNAPTPQRTHKPKPKRTDLEARLALVLAGPAGAPQGDLHHPLVAHGARVGEPQQAQALCQVR